jgi:hypothetical protein
VHACAFFHEGEKKHIGMEEYQPLKYLWIHETKSEKAMPFNEIKLTN